MVNNLDTEKLAQTLKDLKEAVQNTILAFERVQKYITSTLEIIETNALTSDATEASAETEPPLVEESTIPAPAPEPAAPAAESAEPAPEPAAPAAEPAPEPAAPAAEPAPEPAPEPTPEKPAVPTPPPPPPPPEVTTLETGTAEGTPTQPEISQQKEAPVSTFGPGPTASAPSGTNFAVSDSLDKVFQLAQRGGTGLQLHQALLDARDVIQQIVSVHPAFHEIASYSRELKMVGSNPLTDNQQIELKDHLDDWKRRLVK